MDPGGRSLGSWFSGISETRQRFYTYISMPAGLAVRSVEASAEVNYLLYISVLVCEQS